VRSIFAVTDACAGCGACLKTCPEKAIRPAPRDHAAPLVVLEDRCSGCAECAEVCPVSACIEVIPTPHEQPSGTPRRGAP
jgi:electron transport complex protein RnfB